MKTFIIGIAGQKNSGKDTVASMICYINSVGVAAANYQQWLINKEKYVIKHKDNIIHFADKLKDCLSIIYNIPRSYFDNRRYKDELWYNLKEKRFMSYLEIVNDVRYHLIEINDLYQDSLAEIVDHNNRICCIQLRTLLQYFGTEVCRNNLSDMIWVDSTITNAINIIRDKDFCIIPDVRHKIERDAIKNCYLYGGVIVLKRGETSANHSSEDIDFTGDITIENNGSLMQLFYKVLNYLQNI